MKRDTDFHFVRHEHLDTHERLINWSRYVSARFSGPNCSPMFRQYRSDHVWGHGEVRCVVDTLDGDAVEQAIKAMDEKPREALRWAYVFSWIHPRKVCRYLCVSPHTLAELIHDGRSILNRSST